MTQDRTGYTRDPLLRTYGAVLRAHREAAKLSRAQLAEKLGCTPGWIEKLESAIHPPSEATSDDLDVFFETGPARTFWTMWREIKREGKHVAVPPGFPGFVKREATATGLYMFECMVVSGLFQTPEYAAEVLKEGRTQEAIEALVKTRIERKEILHREDPPRIVAVFDEAVIRRPIGGAEVMREQLSHLIEIAERPNVTVQIVPSTKGTYAGIMGAFEMLNFRDAPDVVYVETHTSGHLIDDPDEVEEYALRYDLIRGAALPAEESLELIRAVLEGL